MSQRVMPALQPLLRLPLLLRRCVLAAAMGTDKPDRIFVNERNEEGAVAEGSFGRPYMRGKLFGAEAARRIDDKLRQVVEGRTAGTERVVDVRADVIKVGEPAVRVANVSNGHLRIPRIDDVVLIKALEPVESRAEDGAEMRWEVVNCLFRADREHVNTRNSRHEIWRLMMHHGKARRILNVLPKGLERTFAHDVDFTLVMHQSGELGMVKVTRRVHEDKVVGGKSRGGWW